MPPLYLDASVIVALLTNDLLSDRAAGYFAQELPVVVISDLAASEFAAVIARRVRSKLLTKKHAHTAFAQFDELVMRAGALVEVSPQDFSTSTAWIRSLRFPLTTPDALHLAAAQRLGLALATFDKQLGQAARKIGLSLAPF